MHTPCYSMLFHCYSMVFHAIPCYSVVFHAIPCTCYSMLFHAIPSQLCLPCYSMLFHAIPWYSMLFHAIPCYSLPIPSYSFLFQAIPFYSRGTPGPARKFRNGSTPKDGNPLYFRYTLLATHRPTSQPARQAVPAHPRQAQPGNL